MIEGRRLLVQIAVVSLSIACGYYLLRRTSSIEISTLKFPTKKKRLVILYGTTTGTAKDIAYKLSKAFSSTFSSVLVKDMRDYDYETFLPKEKHIIVIVSTYTDGNPPPSAVPFFQGIQDIVHDFRYSKGIPRAFVPPLTENYYNSADFLSKLRFCMIGLGGKVYKENYCLAVGFVII